MIYDKIELMKLNITEKAIQNRRDMVLKGLTECPEGIKKFKFIISKVWLQFIVDMLEDNYFECRPFGMPSMIEVTVTL